MLSRLTIKNYALIKSVELDFIEGFTTITGETGAGKSILMGALGLVLGDRADKKALFDQDSKCIVEAEFLLSEGQNFRAFFEKNDLDYSLSTILRRELTAAGKSRAFINDTPVSIQLLKEIAIQLVSIHGQHETQFLGTAKFQLELIDTLGGHTDVLNNYQSLYAKHVQLKEQLATERKAMESLKQEEDYLQFQWDEWEVLQWKEGEQHSIEKSLSIMENGAKIQNGLAQSIQLFANEQHDVLSTLKQIEHILEDASALEKTTQLKERLVSTQIELSDIYEEIVGLNESLHFDESELDKLQERIAVFNDLCRKHRIEDESGLIQYMENIEDKLVKAKNASSDISAIEEALVVSEKKLLASANKLSIQRKKVKKQLVTQLTQQIQVLGMPNAKMDVVFSNTTEFTNTGMDHVSFIFTSNKGVEMRPINQVASGGELSRIMFAVKTIWAKSKSINTLIFDEIDTGVSGDVADIMGQMMQEVGAYAQVLSITHLPQVAARGRQQLFVQKEVKSNRTYTGVVQLSKEQRIQEIAKMLSGSQMTEAAVEQASMLVAG